MNRNQLLAIGLAVLIGILLGGFLTNKWYRQDVIDAQYENKRLETIVHKTTNRIDSLKHAYEDLKLEGLSYEKTLNELNVELKAARRENNRLREEARKFTNDEKRTYLINRYRTDNK